MRLVDKNSFLSEVKKHLVQYPTPANLTYFWNFGFLTAICLALQIVTGIILATYYVPHATLAFDSIEYIMREVKFGWLIRYLHMNGASFFFICMYIHILRGMFYGSYKHNISLWVSGIILFYLSMLTAFTGYVLPWGQISFWGAVVITNLITAIPTLSEQILYWIWGGPCLSNATLKKMFAVHFALPFIILLMVCLHLYLLHEDGSSQPLGYKNYDKLGFYPYFYAKDLLSFFILILIILLVIFKDPEFFNHPYNYRKANPLVTPTHLVPEWYFLPMYGVLRSTENKLVGFMLMCIFSLTWLEFPYIDVALIRSPLFRPIFRIHFAIFVTNIGVLTYLGAKTTEYPYPQLLAIATFLYFFTCWKLISIFTEEENKTILVFSEKNLVKKMSHKKLLKLTLELHIYLIYLKILSILKIDKKDMDRFYLICLKINKKVKNWFYLIYLKILSILNIDKKKLDRFY